MSVNGLQRILGLSGSAGCTPCHLQGPTTPHIQVQVRPLAASAWVSAAPQRQPRLLALPAAPGASAGLVRPPARQQAQRQPAQGGSASLLPQQRQQQAPGASALVLLQQRAPAASALVLLLPHLPQRALGASTLQLLPPPLEQLAPAASTSCCHRPRQLRAQQQPHQQPAAVCSLELRRLPCQAVGCLGHPQMLAPPHLPLQAQP